MSWKLIIGLSLFGLAMAFATVFGLPTRTEPYVWLAIFLVCALVIAKHAPGKYFLHGLSVSFVNSAWITTVHVVLFDKYVVGHAHEVAMAAQMGSPKMMMAVTGPVIGIVSGLVLGAFAYVASKFIVSAHSEFAGW